MIKKAGLTILILVSLASGFFYWLNNVKAAALGEVIINEIAWMGTAASSNDEWIELRNLTDQEVDLSGWTLLSPDGSPTINLAGTIAAGGYYLLERSDDETVPGIPADLIYTGALANSGAMLELRDSQANLIAAIDASAGWPAGDNASKQTMARAADGSWQTSQDSGGSPGAINSQGQPEPAEDQYCGNGRLEQGEECDDGNNNNNDGCAAVCLLESDFTPPSGPADELAAIPGEDEAGADQKSYKLGDIVINEFVSDPADGQVEWIEFYNKINDPIDLSDWTVSEGSGAKTKLSGQLDKFLVIEKPKGNLNNAGDIIILRDGQDNLIDQVSYGNWQDDNPANNAPSATDPNAVGRKSDGYNTFNNFNDFSLTVVPTKGESNIIVAAEALDEEAASEGGQNYDYSNDIIISEILPNPAGSDNETEFIELYNRGDRAVDLSGWRLGDETSRKYSIANLSKFKAADLDPIIRTGEYLVIYRSDSKIALNNSSDSIKLYQPEKDQPLETVQYQKALENWSYVNGQIVTNQTATVTNEIWVWTEVVTPGRANIIKTINHAPQADFDYPEQAAAGQPVDFDSSDTIDQDNDQLAFSWDFGDGQINQLASPQHTFLKAGVYSVQLTVSDGEHEAVKEKMIKVIDPGLPELSQLSGQETDQEIKIIINELLPNPAGADADNEFIELYNQGGTGVNLINWQLDDSPGGSRPYRFGLDLWLAAGQYYAVSREESGLALNNTSDAVRLYNNLEELLEEIEYQSAVEGESYARGQNNKWFWTTVFTPGEENIISVAGSKAVSAVTAADFQIKADIPAPVSLENIRDYEVGDQLQLSGIVAVEPGILGAQYFYIISEDQAAAAGRTEEEPKQIALASLNPADRLAAADSGDEMAENSPLAAGIQIYSYKKDFPDLRVGDLIEVSGELSLASGELRLKTKSLADFKIKSAGPVPAARPLAIDQVNENLVGSLISISGEVVARKGSAVYLDDGTDEMIVYIKTASGIKAKEILAGEILTVSGIVGQSSSGVRLMPRSPADIVKKDVESRAVEVGQVLGEVAAADQWAIAERNKKLELFSYLLVLAGGAIVLLVGLLIKTTIKQRAKD